MRRGGRRGSRGPGPLAAVAAVAAVAVVGLLAASAAVPTGAAGAAAPAVVSGSTAGTGFVVVDTFDDAVNGSLRDQGPWHVNVPGSADGAVVADDAPAHFAGKAMVGRLSRFARPVRYRGNAYAELGEASVPAGATGTVFLEVSPTRPADTALHLGLSADPSPGLGLDTTGDPLDLADFGPEVLLDERGLLARDGGVAGVYRPLVGGRLEAGVRYRVWLVVDNAAHRYAVRLARGDAAPVTLRTADGRTDFAFRTPAAAPLTTFLHLNDPVDVPSADTYLDSLHVAPTSVELTSPVPEAATVLDLDGLARGPADGRRGWSASAGVDVVDDPAPDGTDGDRVLRLGLGAQHAAHPLPEVPDGGALFLRMRRSGPADVSLGASDVDRPTGFEDFRVQTGAQGDARQLVRDGGSFAAVGDWPAEAWQCVWLVPDGSAGADGSTGTYAVWSRGGPHRVTTRLRSATGDRFGFRSPADALDRVLAVSRGRGTTWLDDVAVLPASPSGALRAPDGVACPVAPGSAGVPVADPAPATAQPARLELGLRTVAQLPPAAAGSPARRVNAVVPVPGSGADRLAVPSLEGPLYLLDARSGAVTTYLDLAAELPDLVTAPGLGTGFGYAAFAPDFATTGRLYTVHTEAGEALATAPDLDAPPDTRVHGVITEWTATDPAADTFAGSHREVLRLGFSRFTHGIQQIGFDPTARPGSAAAGQLWVGTGDGDETPYFSDRPGSLAAPQGKLLRIDPRPSGGRAYGIPADNPYVGTPGALGEVYASGLRNPHRFGWDAATGRLLLGNIGEKRVDALYEVAPGADFGWNRREGRYRFDPADPGNVYPAPRDPAITPPLLQVGRSAGAALVAGPVYRGRLAALRGRVLLGDVVDGRVRELSAGLLDARQPDAAFHDVSLVVDGRRTSLAALADGGRVDLRFGQDAAGEVYLTSKTLGRVWKVTAARRLAAAVPSCFAGRRTATPRGARAWRPLTPRRWRFDGDEARLVSAGVAAPGPRRPREYAVVRGLRARSFELRAEVRIDRPRSVLGRDVVLLYGYTSPRSFGYVHLSNDTGSYAHNGIYVVDHADRRRVDDQWTGTRSAPPAITDHRWHTVRLSYCAPTGRVEVRMDGRRRPLMTATDRALGGPGGVGFGSFDDYGRIRGVRMRY